MEAGEYEEDMAGQPLGTGGLEGGRVISFG
jgi:hypothetical protein